MKNCFFIAFFVPIFLFSQEKELKLGEISVHELLLLKKTTNEFIINQEQIKILQAEDVGDLLRNIPGISLKNYGGLGAFKSFSARGIGGTHSGIINDGFLLQQTQSSLIDLSSIQTDNLYELSFSSRNSENRIEVVSSYFNASNLRLTTDLAQFSRDTLELRINTKIGSFGQKDVFFSLKYNFRKSYFAVFNKYRIAEGDFPFEIENFDEKIHLRRENNQTKELFSGMNFGHYFKNNSTLKFQLQTNFSDKELPGAVILYNPISHQSLKNKLVIFSGDYYFSKNNWSNKIYFSAKYDELNYVDSAYLNALGYLKSNYYNSNLIAGLTSRIKISNSLKLTMGAEECYSKLNSSSNFNSSIQRFDTKFVSDFFLEKQKLNYQLILGLQQVRNEEIDMSIQQNQLFFTPSFTVLSKKHIPYIGFLNFSMKRTIRVPNFNEMYYMQIGNTALKPEIANQVNIESDYRLNLKMNKFKLNSAVYFNLLENKILAIPTKNLFVWSIQNVGIVQVFGVDFALMHERNFGEKFMILNSFSYTFQDVRDVSDKKSASYKNQLAYTPKHIFNHNLSLNYKNLGLNSSIYMNSKRYSLNENVVSNELNAFYTIDLSLNYIQKLKKSSLRYSFNIKNVTNNSYFYVRNFYMPGRNFLIALAYAFN